MERLRESGVESALAQSVLDACPAGATEAVIATEMASRIPVANALTRQGQARIALVGPTGVGKTTTTAKLAARYALTEKRKVALLTIDTYRIGAVEQLRTYARVMGLPLEVVNSPEEMTGAVARHADKDVLLIDTIGRSPRRSLQLAEIKTFLNVAAPTETHLVLAAPGGLGYLMNTAASFAVLEPTHLIVTKLDEMPQWGAIASLTGKTGLPVSFITDGQEVPRNLVPANAASIATQIVGGIE
jgi:flagellar biosynthesis protein FlhF